MVSQSQGFMIVQQVYYYLSHLPILYLEYFYIKMIIGYITGGG